MAEREYFDYEEWLRSGGDATGQLPPTSSRDPYVVPPPVTATAPAAPTAPTAPPTTGGGTTPPDGSTVPNQDPPGFRGGYWMGGQWVRGERYNGGDPTTPTAPTATSGGEDYWSNFQFPTYNPPTFSHQEFGGFDPFVQPSMDEITGDPVLQAQLTEGQNRLKADRAFRGVLNTGGTLKDIFDWTSDRVKLGAHDAFDRKFRVWDANNQAKFQTWNANKDLAFGSFDRNAPQQRDSFLFNQYEPAKLKFDDAYRRWKAEGDWISGMDVS